jgi:hypothetical protein
VVLISFFPFFLPLPQKETKKARGTEASARPEPFLEFISTFFYCSKRKLQRKQAFFRF